VTLDRTILGNVAAEQMQALEESYGDDDTVEIGAVLTIVQVVRKVGDGEEYASVVRMRHNVGDPYAAIGDLRAAEQTLVQAISGGDPGA
jgi:hypothetical protein